MGMKKSLLLRFFAALTVSCICLALTPNMANAAQERREYEVTGQITADGPMFQGENTLNITNGYYVINTDTTWTYFTCESADGTLSIQYFLEKDNVYRFIITDTEETQTYKAAEAGLIDHQDTIQGVTFYADGYNLDFSGLSFTPPKERLAAGIYEALGSNSLSADYVQARIYGSVIDIHFFKDGNLIRNLAGNYHSVNAEGTVTYTDDYQGFFKASVTNEGKLYGGFVSDQGEKPIEFEMTLKEPVTIKDGSYSAKGKFAAGIDEIRIHTNHMDYVMELVDKGNVIKMYELALMDAGQDGTLTLGAYDGSDLQSLIHISPDGNLTGDLYAGYNIVFDTPLKNMLAAD